MTLCPFCYTENLDNAIFCSGCGAAMSEEAAQAPGAREPEPPPEDSGSFRRRKTKAHEEPLVKAGTLVSQGQTIAGRYMLLAQAGAGHYASVWKASDLRSGRTVAVKVLEFSPFDEDGAAQMNRRFRREGEICMQLRHDNVIAVLDCGEHEGTPFYVMEWMKGRSLKDILKHEGCLEPSRAVGVAMKMLAGLEHAHAAGVLHRDLKPANVLVDEADGTVKLSDFGIAKVLDESPQGGRLTRPGTLLGTVEYMAPEYVRDGTMSPSTDIYSFGVMFYEMLTGFPPFQARKPMDVLKMQMTGHPKPPSQVARDAKIPPFLDSLVLRCLEKNPADRFETVTELLQQMVKALAAEDSAEGLLGKTLRDYQIVELLGRGGMASVYKARHMRLGSFRAIKVIRKDLARQPNFYERFCAEAQIAEKFSHPSLAVLHDFSQTDDGLIYAVWEYVDGKTLAQHMEELQGRPYPAAEAVRIARQAAQGLSHAHARGIVHRDIAPDNLILQESSEGPRVKVIDFGIAKQERATRRGQTDYRAFLGKVGYSAPEQLGNLNEGETVDGRADVFSLGVVLYEMLAGRLLFKSDSFFNYMREVAAFDSVRLEFPGSVPEGLRQVVRQALMPEREQRFKDMASFDEALKICLQKPAVSAPPPAPVAVPPPAAKAAPPAAHAPEPSMRRETPGAGAAHRPPEEPKALKSPSVTEPPRLTPSQPPITTPRARMEAPAPVEKRTAFQPPEAAQMQKISMENISLSSLLANLYRRRLTGVLTLASGRKSVLLYLENGYFINILGDGAEAVRELKDAVSLVRYLSQQSGAEASFGHLSLGAVPKDFRLPLSMLVFALCGEEDVRRAGPALQGLKARPRLNASLSDLARLTPISSSEAYFLSQIEGGGTFAEYLAASPIPPEDARRLLVCLSRLGIIQVSEKDPEWLDVDLLEYLHDQEHLHSSEEEAECKKILEFYARVKNVATPSQVLGLSMTPHSSQIEEAHARLTEEWKPEKFLPSTARAMSHELGVIRMRIGEAVRMLQGARERPAGAMEEGGDTDFSQEKFKRRLGDFKSSKEKQQESMAKQAKGLLQQALAAYEKKDYWNSITLAEGAIQLDPGMAEAYMALGMAQAKNPKWGKKALAALEKAVSMDPLSEKIHLVFIEVLVEKNLKSRAKAEAQKLLESHPDSAAGKALLKSIGK